jgi:hypothetical protein
VFDASPADNLVLRVLSPSRSGLVPSRDYLRGQSPRAAILAALDRSVAALTKQFGADPATWRAVHPRSTIDSLTGVIGPSTTMPYEDRGSWIHVVAFRGKPVATSPVTLPPQAPPAGRLPATGASTLPALAGLLMLGAVLWRRRVATGG